MIKRLMAKIMQLPFFAKRLCYTKSADMAVDIWRTYKYVVFPTTVAKVEVRVAIPDHLDGDLEIPLKYYYDEAD